jgi:predicted ATPase/DNA-binding SARP family transcriptional activator/DNA-binding CsgD family transcriptional regulator
MGSEGAAKSATPTAERPEAVRIWLLGTFRISVGSRTIDSNQWRLRKAAALVKLLALAPGYRLHREQAMELLWPDSGRKAASTNLRRALHAARRILDSAAGSRYLASENESLVLCPEGQLWVDVEAFKEVVATARRSREPAAYRAAIELYTGELLPTDRYEEWAEGRRQELRRTFLSLLVKLAKLHEQREDYEPAIEAMSRVVSAEPTNEEAHADLMRLYALSGRRAESLKQYEHLEEALSRGLGIEPAASSRALKEEIEKGRFPPSSSSSTKATSEDGVRAVAVDAGRHNLPAARTRFVGREWEMLEVKRTLAMTRLLTLTGGGGSGKTRLALEVARGLVGVYSDGVWLVELAPLMEGELVPQAVADALGIRERPGQPLVDTLIDVLRTKQMLLVLDNCEHLIDAVALFVDTLLASCLRLRVLVTSREILGVAGEVVWRMPSLSVPRTDCLPDTGELTQYDAVRLFLDRARLRLPAFDLTPENASAVADVSRKLEGIPLAIELATARVGALSVEQMAEKLKEPLKVLSVGPRTATSRQQTLRGTLDWSYRLLSEPERQLFRRLAVFVSGFTLEAAEAVGKGDGIEEGDVLDLLSRLVDKSLVEAEVGAKGMPRYGMLEPVRQYAQERLRESGEADTAQRQHMTFFLALAEEVESSGRGRRTQLKHLETEQGNLRAALSWSLYPEDLELKKRAESGLRLATALAQAQFWAAYGPREGLRWLERGLAKSSTSSTSVRAAALNEAGFLAVFQEDHKKAVEVLEEGFAFNKRLGEEVGTAIALNNVLQMALQQGDYGRVETIQREAETLLRKSTDRRASAYLLLALGIVAVIRGDRKGGMTLLEESLALNQEVGNRRGITMCLTVLWVGALKQGEYERAAVLLKKNLQVLQELKSKIAIAYALLGSAVVASSQGQAARATRLWGAVEVLQEGIIRRFTPFDLAEYDYESHLDAARSQLDETAWEAAWAEGQEMTPDEAVEYALSDEEEQQAAIAPSMPEEPSVGRQPAAVLTRREREVANLVARGLSNRQIASELFLSERTIENHVANILKKLSLRSREQVASHLGGR